MINDSGNSGKFSVVVNHFSSSDRSFQLSASTLLSITLALQSNHVAEAIVVDGSLTPDEHLRDEILRVGGRYHHAGRMLSFAEGYNIGVGLSRSDWVVLSASDIYPNGELFDLAADFLRDNASRKIGCLVPRLTTSDLPLQETSFSSGKALVIPVMTLNINFFSKQFLLDVGGVPEQYSGAYNDVELSLSLAKEGFEIIMLPNLCMHYGRLTWSTSLSNYRYVTDREKFFSRHPELAQEGGFWDIDIAQLFTGRLRLAIRLVSLAWSGNRRIKAIETVLRWAPVIDRRMIV